MGTRRRRGQERPSRVAPALRSDRARSASGALRAARVLLAFALALALGRPVRTAPFGDRGPTAWRAQGQTVAGIHARFEGTEGAAFRDLVAASLEKDPAATRSALVLRAGSDDPPGVTGARAERRLRRRADALLWFREAGEAGHDLLREVLSMRGAEGGAPEAGDEELLCAALRVCGRLPAYPLAADVARNLDDDRSPRTREVARRALRSLFGRWFPGRAEFEALWPRLEGKTPEDLFLDELLRATTEVRELKEIVFAVEPMKAVEAFADSPAERTLAARGLVRAVGNVRMELPRALDYLLRQLSIETDPGAFQAELDAALELVVGFGPSSEHVTNLRALLTDPATLGRAQVSGTLAQAFARLPWGTAPEAKPGDDAHVLRGVGLVASLVDRIGRADAPTDYDRFSVALEGLRALVDRAAAEDRGAVRGAVAPAGRAVLHVALEEVGPLEARLDAARAIDLFLEIEHLPVVQVLLEPGAAPPALQTNLLGPVSALVAKLRPENELAQEIVRGMFQATRSEDVDLRRRALELLSGPALAAHVDAQAASPELGDALVEGLSAPGAARSQALRTALLARLAPRPELVTRLLASPNFDALLDGTGRGRESLVDALARHAGADLHLYADSARRLARDQRAAPPPEAATPEVRRALALRLFDLGGPDVIDGLAEAQRLELVRIATAVRRDGGAVPKPIAERASTAWLDTPGLADVERDWTRALFVGDAVVAAGADTAGRSAAVLESFEHVLGALATDEAGAGALLGCGAPRVRLARARFYAGRGDLTAAAPDFATLFGAEPSTRGAKVGLVDLRSALRALARPYPVEATRAGLELLASPDWPSSSREERLADLQALGGACLEGGDPDLVSRVRALFAGVPDPSIPTQSGGAATGNGLFESLLTQPETHRELWALAERLAEADVRRSPDPGPAKEPTPATLSEEDGEEG